MLTRRVFASPARVCMKQQCCVYVSAAGAAPAWVWRGRGRRRKVGEYPLTRYGLNGGASLNVNRNIACFSQFPSCLDPTASLQLVA